MRGWNLHRMSDQELTDLSRMFNPKIRGWVTYYGRDCRTALRRAFRPLNRRLVRWAQQKYKRLRRHQNQSKEWMSRFARSHSTLFGHWAVGIVP
jgi:RNA-directed DNA polymerase